MEPPFDPILNETSAWSALDAWLTTSRASSAAASTTSSTAASATFIWTGPSGCGKTTTLREWCRAQEDVDFETVDTSTCEGHHTVLDHLTKATTWRGMSATGHAVTRRIVCLDDFDTFCQWDRFFPMMLLNWARAHPMPPNRALVICGGDELEKRRLKWARLKFAHVPFQPRPTSTLMQWLARHPNVSRAIPVGLDDPFSWAAYVNECGNNLRRLWAAGDHAHLETQRASLRQSEYELFYRPDNASVLAIQLEKDPTHVLKFHENLPALFSQCGGAMARKLDQYEAFLSVLATWDGEMSGRGHGETGNNCSLPLLAASWYEMLQGLTRRKNEVSKPMEAPKLLSHVLLSKKRARARAKTMLEA